MSQWFCKLQPIGFDLKSKRDDRPILSQAQSSSHRTDPVRLLATSRRTSPSLRFPAELRRFNPLAWDEGYKTLLRDYEIISHSPLFDPVWYVESYKNVAAQREDPIHHFLKFGCEYALSPGPYFDSKAYLSKHKEVFESGENPLLHFIRTCTSITTKPSLLDRFRVLRGRHPSKVAVDDLYLSWIKEYESIGRWARDEQGPKVSFLIIPRPGDNQSLSETLVSLDALGDNNWQVILAGNAPTRSAYITEVVVESQKRGKILEALLEAADGDFFAVLDAGDRLSPHTLQEFWRCIRNRPDLDIVYSDEDLIGPDGREMPFLKPDWSPEYLDSFNYFGRLTFIRRSIALALGSFSDVYNDAAEYDLNLRISEASQRIGRIVKILCHRPVDAIGERPQGDAGADRRRALVAAWGRRGITAAVSSQADGTLRSTWPLTSPPLVSIVIPNKDRPDLLRTTLSGLLKQTDYSAFEVIIVDNLSTDSDLLALYEEVGSLERVSIISFTEPFNYSAACNLGAKAANGSLLLFLNNDIEVTTPDWLSELVRCVERPGVGVAGTMLVYPDGALQHAGVVIGMHSGCGLVFRAAELHEWGVFGSPSVPRNYLGIMGACQILRREVFNMVGGFDETYQIANSDIALSIAAWRLGYRTVYTPHAKLIHHEGASRGYENPSVDYARTVRDFETFGILADPYFHPALSANMAIPALCISPDLSTPENLSDQTQKHLANYPQPSQMNVYDTNDVVRAVGRDAAGKVFWASQRSADVTDAWSAMRFIVDLLRRDPSVRMRFPLALNGKGNGPFAQWLTSGDGKVRFELSPLAISSILAAFALLPGDLVRRAYIFDEDVRRTLPLGCTPGGIKDLFIWLVNNGRQEHKLRLEAIWWFLIECTERPAEELMLAYSFNPDWQHVYPDGLTIFACRDFSRWLKVMYRIDGEWLDPSRWPVALSPAEQIRLAYYRRDFWQKLNPNAFASQADSIALLEWLKTDEAGVDPEARKWLWTLDTKVVAADLARVGANVLGHFCYPSGLRTSAESIVKGLNQVECATSVRDIWVEMQKDDPGHADFVGLEIFDTTIIHTQPEPFFRQSYTRAGLFQRRPRTYRIAYWYWELDEIPENWLEEAEHIDEIWVATRFVGDAMRARFDKPVFEMLPGLEIPPFCPQPRNDFGLLDGRFTFLFVFHMMSIMERKNPLGLIRAFRTAFGDAPQPQLVLKTSFGDRHPELLQQLHEAAAGEGIKIIDAIYSAQETLSIINICDCYVSLHRSEGYGLTMAEAMLLGKPVIATAYSGNLDFMNETNSLLVSNKIVTLEREYPPYPAGARWAEPSIDHAASCMRRVVEDRCWAKSLGIKAQADASAHLSHATSGKRMAERLDAINLSKRDKINRRLIRFPS